jgi:hypothetical protein
MRNSAKPVTTRGLSKAPAPLAQFLEAVNVKPGFEYTDITELAEDINRDAKRNSDRRSPFLLDRCRALLEQLPQPAQDFIGHPKDLRLFCRKYQELKTARATLLAITSQSRHAKSFASHKAIRQGTRQLQAGLPFVSIAVYLMVNEAGEIQRVSNALLDALEGVSVDRIRSCVWCERLFWGKKANSFGCTTRCRNNYTQKRNRGDLKARDQARISLVNEQQLGKKSR